MSRTCILLLLLYTQNFVCSSLTTSSTLASPKSAKSALKSQSLSSKWKNWSLKSTPTTTTSSTSLSQMFLENSVPCLDRSIRHRKRPSSKVDIDVNLAVIAIHDLSSVNMDLRADVYLYQSWRDPRCAFRPLPGQGSVLTLRTETESSHLSHPGLANLWQPDTHFVNAKSSSKLEIVSRLRSHGLVETRTRFAITTSCPMDLRLFPMDRQKCSLLIQSSSHDHQELNYFWNKGNETQLVFAMGLDYQSRMTPGLRLLGYRFASSLSQFELSGSEFDQIVLDIFLERPLGFFLWEVYMPATFIVVIAFTSFWLDCSATPARVSLGVTTVLTMTTLLSGANINLPPTAYPKALGIFLAGCFVFTFLAFLEYSAANYIERRKYGGQKRLEAKFEEFDRKTSNTTLDGACAVDSYSRIIFPLLFVAFQVIYWTICLKHVDQLPDDAVAL